MHKITPVMTSIENVLFITSAARSRCFFPSSPPCCAAPRAIENNGVPPEPNKFANAVTISKIGNVTPTPVSASTDVSEICPIYMRSTILYKTFTNCASTIGTARRRIVLEIGPFEKSSFFFISAAILLPFRIKK